MPYDRLKCFGMRGDGLRAHHRNDHGVIGDLGRIPAVPSYDPDDLAETWRIL
jgi:hypothetical protein